MLAERSVRIHKPVGTLKQIEHTDNDALLALAQQIAKQPYFWDDRAREQPLVWFATTFGNPNSLIFDVADGQGVIAFSHIQPGFDARSHIACWSREGYSFIKTVRKAFAVAMLYHNLLAINGFIQIDNRPARLAARLAGARYRGIIQKVICYNGVMKDAVWYEATRELAGLPPITPSED